MNAWGFGGEKLPDLNHNLSFFGSVWYYPNVKGTYTNVASAPINPLSYDLGVQPPEVSGRASRSGSATARSSSRRGWMGDSWTNKQNAPDQPLLQRAVRRTRILVPLPVEARRSLIDRGSAVSAGPRASLVDPPPAPKVRYSLGAFRAPLAFATVFSRRCFGCQEANQVAPQARDQERPVGRRARPRVLQQHHRHDQRPARRRRSRGPRPATSASRARRSRRPSPRRWPPKRPRARRWSTG